MIGVLDSGFGGLSVLREIRALLPDRPVNYIGDNAWCPYGTRSVEEITERVSTLTSRLISEGAEVIVLACNSATIASIEILRDRFDLPFVGMEPGVKPAAAISRTGVIGVLATEVSLRGDKYQELISTHAGEVEVISQPCPRFVELVEAGILEGPEVEAAIDLYTKDMMARNADTLILGCSHYPFLKPALISRLPSHISFVDTGDAIARQVGHLSRGTSLDATVTIETSGDPDQFNRVLAKLTPEIEAHCQALHLA